MTHSPLEIRKAVKKSSDPFYFSYLIGGYILSVLLFFEVG